MSGLEQANEKRRAKWAARSAERKKMLAGPELYDALKKAREFVDGEGMLSLTAEIDAALKLADEGGTGRTL